MRIKTTLLLIIGLYHNMASGQLIIDNTQTVENYVIDTLYAGSNAISNLTYNGSLASSASAQVGYFDATNANFPLGKGIIISSGNVMNALGPNSSASITTGTGSGGDSDLTQSSGFNTYDKAVIEFDITANSDILEFQYSFASDEYPEYSGSNVNDAFVILISGPGISGTYSNNSKNIALVPSTNIPVNINNINNGLSNTGPCVNCSFYNQNGTGGGGAPYSTNAAYIEFDGFTDLLTASSSVVCGETYHIKIGIADAGDTIFDSAAFFQVINHSNSENVDLEVSYNDILDTHFEVEESCVSGEISFDLTASLSYPVTFFLSTSGTSSGGIDYSSIPDQIIFNPGQTSVQFPINFINDEISESTESLILEITDDQCAHPFEQTIEFSISDLPDITNEEHYYICEGDSIEINQEVFHSPGTYIREIDLENGCSYSLEIIISSLLNYELTQEAEICQGETYYEGNNSYTEAGSYSNAYFTELGCDSIINTELIIHPLESSLNEIELCIGASYTEGTSVYTEAGTYTDLYSTIFGCDSLVTTTITIKDDSEFTQQIEICEGESHGEGNNTYLESGTYTDVYVGSNLCDSLVITELTVNQNYSFYNEVSICAGDILAVGDSTYSETGIYENLFTTAKGCDSLINTELYVQELFQITNYEQICEGESYTEGSSSYDTTGVFTDIYQDELGCDSIIITDLIVHPKKFRTNEVSICEGTTYQEGESIYSEEGTYLDYYFSSLGCDSLVTTNLTFKPLYSINDYEAICAGEIFIKENQSLYEPGIYSFFEETDSSCISTELELTHLDCSCELYVPNAFTPDGDGLNEQFLVAHDCDFYEFEMLIFNRWGQVVFKSNSPEIGWIGNNLNGDYFVPNGVYTYLIIYSSRANQNTIDKRKITGLVTIIR